MCAQFTPIPTYALSPIAAAPMPCHKCGKSSTSYVQALACRHVICKICYARYKDAQFRCPILTCNALTNFQESESQCPNTGCTRRYSRATDLDDHMRTCQLQMMLCRYCRQEVPRGHTMMHRCQAITPNTAPPPASVPPPSLPQYPQPRPVVNFPPQGPPPSVTIPQQQVPQRPQQVTTPTTPTTPLQARGGAPSWDNVTPADIVKKRKISEGAQGSIHEATIRGFEPTMYAVKTIKVDTPEQCRRELIKAKRLQTLKHEHLIRYYAALEDTSSGTPQILIVMEFYQEENLAFFIRHTDAVPEEKILSLGLQVTKALEYLHSRTPRLAHADVKPENMLMFEGQSRVVLTDLESIHEIPCAADRMGDGTFEWAAPEFVQKQSITCSVDIWSLGVVMFVLARLPDFPALTVGSEIRLLNDKVWASGNILAQALLAELKPRGYSNAFITLIAAMTQHSPEKRPNANKLVELISEIMEANLLGLTV
eukprot:PhF_6_TR22554/c0_g1_i1/m.32078